ncbi:MAG: hypothetical protein V1725_00095 [archaeon]
MKLLHQVRQRDVDLVLNGKGGMDLLTYLVQGIMHLRQENGRIVPMLEILTRDYCKDVSLLYAINSYFLLDAAGTAHEEEGYTHSGLPIIGEDAAELLLNEHHHDPTHSYFARKGREGLVLLRQNKQLYQYVKIETITQQRTQEQQEVALRSAGFMCLLLSERDMYDSTTKYIDCNPERFPKSCALRRELDDVLQEEAYEQAALLKQRILETGESL